MCEIEDLSLGHQDIYFNKYSDRFVSGTMDFYITDSLQDMLDIDIKSEMATDLGSTTDFSDALGVSFSDLPPLLDIEMDNATAWVAGSNASLHNSSNFVHNLDLYGSEANAVMVNPNSVMPSMFSESPVKTIVNQNSSNLMLNSVNSDSVNMSPLPSPSEEKSHLTFSPNTINFPKIKQEPVESEEDSVNFGDVDSIRETSNFVFIKSENLENIKKDLTNELDYKPIKLSGPPPTIRIKAAQPELLKLNTKSCSILNTNQRVNGTQYVTTQTLGTKTIISGNIHILGHQQSRTLLTNSNKSPATILIDNATINNNRQIIKTTMSANAFSDSVGAKFIPGNKISFCGEFPKPAYSYSCLIAMALKNSRTGSLPVSEIYNFMCQHFPYFKTAPNGWKNSVRHNLSLNKCFEKIEKPSTNGGQRKGCLWAMNPSKVGKMDEEVQKWSRKDPQAIRKAMVRPDSLEALERGEMKYCGEGELEGDGDIDNDGEGIVSEQLEEDCSEEEELDVDEAFLLATSPTGSPSPLMRHHYDDENSDVEVMDGAYDEIDIEESHPIKLEFALASQFHHTESSAKRPKTNYIYQTISTTPSHVNRRKTPLVNRIA